ncbi:hypothetical protein EVAR_103454_1 [Eumeta japonica]|uniref:Retinol dehydrogenase 11 n=1 Tax=Eumeta variegata TaxID=151549 RepID=A0A4C1Z0K9_EUMVA|nr:hypothetical protein EVAR_103454_1 [Eumeta japonica]
MFVAILFLIVFAFVVYQKTTRGVCTSTTRLDGKVAIVTGGTAGIGREIALDFAKRRAKVIIACPFRDEGEAARNEIIKVSGNKQVIYEFLDLSSLKSTREFASNILKTEPRLDILVNNAGVGTVGDFMTKDGLNFIMQVNYFGHFLLTLLLLPLLKKTTSSRIVNQTSVLNMIGSVNIKFLNTIQGYWNTLQLYSNSKLCLILFGKELSRKLKHSGVSINCSDPGAVGTNIFANLGQILGKFLQYIFLTVFKTPEYGAQTAIHVAVDAGVDVSGEVFRDCRLSWFCNRQAFDEELCSKLWEETIKLVQLQDHEIQV